MTPEGVWWIKREMGGWTQVTSPKAARHIMEQNWLGGPHHVNDVEIAAFMKDDPPIIAGGIMVPTSTASIIEVFDKIKINTWRNTIRPGDPEALNDLFIRHAVTLLLRMLRESLCNQEQVLGLEDMLAVAAGDDPNEVEFRFMINWLAAPIQQPGLNLQTNLWLLGNEGGGGKGTLVEIMAMIYGGDLVARMQGDDIQKGGWTDCLEAKLFAVMNEINPDGKFDWEGFIKQNSTDDVVPLRKRNHHSYQILNFANWLFTTNKESPACLDSTDRRNFLCATSQNPEKIKLALDLQKWMISHPDDVARMVGGFVALLHHHKVNREMLYRAPDTEIKRNVQEETSKESEHEYWLRYDLSYPRDLGLYAHDLIGPFATFMRKPEPEIRKFAGALGRLARHGKIKRYRDYTTSPWKYLIQSTKYPNSGLKKETNPSNVLTLLPKQR